MRPSGSKQPCPRTFLGADKGEHMSVRKREWATTQGEQREAWIVDYFDAGGTRRLKTFKRKKEADAWSNKTGVARGYVTRNAVRELRGRRRGNGKHERHNGKLKVGVDIPTPAEIKAIVEAAKDRWRPFLITAIFTGMRASELRGLPWSDIDLRHEKIHVRQRADRWNTIGPPKSATGERTIPLPPIVVSELREWKLRCPKKDGRLELVFPNGEGNPEAHPNLIERGLKPTLIAAGVTMPLRDSQCAVQRDEHGKPMLEAKYTGLHALRHFYASWCINRKADGGLALPAKMVQGRMGHSSILVTMDTYGHPFPGDDSGAELAAAERVLLG
jgi:integrase